MGTRHTRLAAVLSTAWVAEVETGRRLTWTGMLAEQQGDFRRKARLNVLAAFCRAHASRLLARIAAMGRGPLPVPAEDVSVDDDFATELRANADFLDRLFERYETMAQLAREHCDLSSAWACDLNRAECRDMARELRALAVPLPALAGVAADIIVIDDPLLDADESSQKA